MKTKLVLSALFLFFFSVTQPVIAAPGDITEVSLPAMGSQANNDSNYPSISSDGRYVAFESLASNLVLGDTNNASDIFVHDRLLNQTSRVSVDSSGVEANGSSNNPKISADGRFVVFTSTAANLIPGDTNAFIDIFIHDRNTAATSRVSKTYQGNQSNGHSFNPSISADGRYIAYESIANNLVPSDTNSLQDIFLHDTTLLSTTRLSVGPASLQSNGTSLSPSISGDGKFVSFTSDANNLVPSDTNNATDVFVNQLSTNLVTRVSVINFGGQSNGPSTGSSISNDGRFVAFHSSASNLVEADLNNAKDVFLHDRLETSTLRVSIGGGGDEANSHSEAPAISSDGSFVAFESIASNLAGSDANGLSDVFVHRPTFLETNLASAVPSGASANGASFYASISGFGDYVAFMSTATNLVAGDTNAFDDVFVYDRNLGLVTLISKPTPQTQANASSYSPAISSDGRFVAFSSFASNLVVGDSNGFADIFVHDRLLSTTSRVSVSSAGIQANGDSTSPTISGDGRYVAFISLATNLVAGDNNASSDIFRHDRLTGTTLRASLDSFSLPSNDASYSPSISSDGMRVAFESYATNLVAGDTNGRVDIFVRDFSNFSTMRVSLTSGGAQSDGHSYRPSLSADGLKVAFESDATNLSGVDTNLATDIFVRDIFGGSTSRVSVSSAGTQANGMSTASSISADGRYVAFTSYASNLVDSPSPTYPDVFRHDRLTGATTQIPYSSETGAIPQFSRKPIISADGQIVVFDSVYLVLSNPDNYQDEFFTIHNFSSGMTKRVNCNPLHEPCYASVSQDGRLIAFQSIYALVQPEPVTYSDIFVYENDVKSYLFVPVVHR